MNFAVTIHQSLVDVILSIKNTLNSAKSLHIFECEFNYYLLSFCMISHSLECDKSCIMWNGQIYGYRSTYTMTSAWKHMHYDVCFTISVFGFTSFFTRMDGHLCLPALEGQSKVLIMLCLLYLLFNYIDWNYSFQQYNE